MSKFNDWYNEMHDSFWSGMNTFQIAFEAGQKAGQEWIPVSEKLPKKCNSVLIKGFDCKGYITTAKAMYCRKFECKANVADENWCDYNKDNNRYYLPCGWWEITHCTEIDIDIDFKVTHWQEFPNIN